MQKPELISSVLDVLIARARIPESEFTLKPLKEFSQLSDGQFSCFNTGLVTENHEHIIEDNKERFPEPYKSMDNYSLQTFLKSD